MRLLNDGVTVDSFGRVIVSSLKHRYPKLYNRILCLASIRGFDESYIERRDCTCGGLFVFANTSEGSKFWLSVNKYDSWQYAQEQQPHLFEQSNPTITLNEIKF